MYEVYFYQDQKGNFPILDYITDLASKHDKDSRIKLHKIQDYINVLKTYGKLAGEPYVKHLDGRIWELRPLKHRILFAGWTDDGYVLLHQFIKKTRKTPLREIEKAKRALSDFERRDTNGQDCEGLERC